MFDEIHNLGESQLNEAWQAIENADAMRAGTSRFLPVFSILVDGLSDATNDLSTITDKLTLMGQVVPNALNVAPNEAVATYYFDGALFNYIYSYQDFQNLYKQFVRTLCQQNIRPKQIYVGCCEWLLSDLSINLNDAASITKICFSDFGADQSIYMSVSEKSEWNWDTEWGPELVGDIPGFRDFMMPID